MDEQLAELDRLGRDVLRLCEVPRAAADIAFLHPGTLKADVAACLARLQERGWVVQDEHGLWRRTEQGDGTLREAEAWEALVDEGATGGTAATDEGTAATAEGTAATAVTVSVRRGRVYEGDFFLVDGTTLGRVVAVEQGRDPTSARAVLRTDIPLQPGAVLTAHQPVVA